MITLHGRATAFNVQKVAWLLEELGPPYRRVDVGGEFGTNPYRD
jgi:glutathione S-transferase